MSLEMHLHDLTAAIKELAQAFSANTVGKKVADVVENDSPPEQLPIKYGNRNKAQKVSIPACTEEQKIPPPSKDAMIKVLLEVGQACGRDTLKGILADHNAANASTLKPEQYASVIKAGQTALRMSQSAVDDDIL